MARLKGNVVGVEGEQIEKSGRVDFDNTGAIRHSRTGKC